MNAAGTVSYDSFWYHLNGKNPVTLTAAIGAVTRSFTVQVELPVLVSYQIEDVGCILTPSVQIPGQGELLLYAKITGLDADGISHSFDFNSLAANTIQIRHSGLTGCINNWGYMDSNLISTQSDVFYQRIPEYFLEDSAYPLNITVTIGQTAYAYELPLIIDRPITESEEFTAAPVEQFQYIYVDARLGTQTEDYDYTELSADYQTEAEARAVQQEGQTIIVLYPGI